MPDRRRFAVVLTPLLGLLAALLLGWSGAAAQAGDPLTLTLTAERAQCTEATLNPVTWTVTGGTPPYTVTVDGETAAADATSVNATCGTLPEPAPGGTPLTEAPGTIPGTVTDATGAPATASAAYTIVPPLPAPEKGEVFYVSPDGLSFDWYTVETLAGGDELVAFLMRSREVGSTAWSYRSEAPTSNPGIRYRVEPGLWGLREVVAYEAAVAAMRHPLEAETPAALHWTPSLQATTVTYPANVTVTATHDTVTVRWDRQPSATSWNIILRNPDGSTGMRISPSDADGWGDPASATHEVTFRQLAPDTEYSLSVGFGSASELVVARYVDVTVRTKAAPAGSTLLPRGPQNLRATSTATSITVTWDPPFAGAAQDYLLFLFGPDGRRLYVKAVYDPPWTFTFTSSAVNGGLTPWYLAPETTYRIFVQHIGTVHADAEVAITTKARAAPPLGLTLTKSRAECTAGTLNPVTWEIEGGVEPYRLTVDGAPVDADAEGTTVTCGALPDYGIWLPVTEAPGTIPGTVTDATGAPATASAAYTIVPPLPAPANFQVGVHPGFVYSSWDLVRGAGSQFPEFDASQLSPAEQRKRNLDGYLVRYRTAAASAWTYAEHSDGEYTTQYGYLSPWDTPPPGTFYTASVAAARHPLELETPEALNWSAPIRYTTSGPAQNLTVRATHNSVTVSWSKQPGTGHASAHLENPRGGSELRILTEGDEPGTHTVTFNHLEPNSEYKIWIFQLLGDGRAAVSRSFRTAAAPPDWQPLPRGPQNLRATATHDTITVTWDPPFEGASPRWSMAMLDGEILVHSARISDGTTTWVISGEVDSIGRYRIRPDTTYTIIVRHEGVYLVKQTMTVTTQATPAAQSTGPVETCIEITPGWRICWTPAPAAG